MAARVHSELAPSASARWGTCPGSVALIKKLPPAKQDKPNKYSLEGDIAHALLEKCLTDMVSPESQVGQQLSTTFEPCDEYPLGVYTQAVDKEMAKDVGKAFNYVHKRFSEMGAGATLWIEEGVDCGANMHVRNGQTDSFGRPMLVPAPREGCKGTPDIRMLGDQVLEVVDYKHGVKFVDEKNNTQLLLYLIGALNEIEVGKIQRVRLTIIQPRVMIDEERKIRTWEFKHMEDLYPFIADISEKAHRVTEDAPRVAGDHCKNTYCPARELCPEYAAKAMEVFKGSPTVQSDSEGNPVNDTNVTPLHPEQAQTNPIPSDLLQQLASDPVMLSNEQLSALLDAEALVKDFFKVAHEQALGRLKVTPGCIPGYKVVRGRSNRKWALDTDEMLKKFSAWNRIGDDGKASGKLKKGEYSYLAVISPAEAEKRIRPMVTPRTWENIQKLIVKPPGALTVAPMSDSRHEVPVSGEQVFDMVDSQPAEEVKSELPSYLL